MYDLDLKKISSVSDLVILLPKDRERKIESEYERGRSSEHERDGKRRKREIERDPFL